MGIGAGLDAPAWRMHELRDAGAMPSGAGGRLLVVCRRNVSSRTIVLEVPGPSGLR
jgi:hypothetical protein